jgi:hypothetical protein
MNPAFLVIDSRARRSVYLDEARANEQAATLHGEVVALTPQWRLDARIERAREARGLLPKAGQVLPADVHARLMNLLGEE